MLLSQIQITLRVRPSQQRGETSVVARRYVAVPALYEDPYTKLEFPLSAQSPLLQPFCSSLQGPCEARASQLSHLAMQRLPLHEILNRVVCERFAGIANLCCLHCQYLLLRSARHGHKQNTKSHCIVGMQLMHGGANSAAHIETWFMTRFISSIPARKNSHFLCLKPSSVSP